MRHLDLFSGIGGFALATEMVWENVEHTFCDIDPFCRAVLRKHWPRAEIHEDIKKLDGGGFTGAIDLLTGGFPCQPFSMAGKRRGTQDDRHLWPEMLRLIREIRPRWVLGENVSGLITWSRGLVFESVCTDLESAGYSVQSFVVPASAVGAPHRRDRVWIVAHARGDDDRGGTGQHARESIAEGLRQPDEVELARVTDKIRLSSDTDGTRLQGAGSSGEGPRPTGLRDRAQFPERDLWAEEWPAFATRLCVVDDGLPRGLVRPRGWRNAALKAGGNAIVPQVAAEFMRAIREVDLCATL